MPAVKAAANWQIATQSVRGASHEQSGAPNQDAVGAQLLTEARGVVLAVADGHGDDRHARSDRGSRFAVAAGIEVVAAWMEQAATLAEADLRRSAQGLPARIVKAWRAKVEADVKADPPADRHDLEGEGVELLYGSTLVVAGIGGRFDVFLQVGDGDILSVAPDGAVKRRARGRTDLPSHLTESMCQADAVDRFRMEFVMRGRRGGDALVMLSSDGYANSFADDAAFLKVGLDLKGLLEGRGLDHVADKLAQWLTETSHEGSGDDISLALAWDASPRENRRRKRRLLARAGLSLVLLAILIPLVTWAYFPSAWNNLKPAKWPQVLASLVEKIQGRQGAGDAVQAAPEDLPPLP
ncbi:protein phosphatase 2C domain-containing protein [Chelatococcus asaccharovorans]|uniref:Protein phosphatase 2C-like protein n=1 Tax=Chelatococcus asaccharovorans TaxID=28210 RepID=A0A2V3TXN1_9HYPH|nr:protein phosphatase 2C domain-containing protein [Chelatococcus asaccharovorans]MBS7704649.1 protein phosphatase 2C domain-containing protein [Chelatococcus asaccharovorans]PXW54550.1 protein phosphatase 2C-like protein [Chelatococcus asaccharovorans]